MDFHVMTLFPDMITDGLNTSITGRAIKAGVMSVTAHDIRDYSNDKHLKVDDYPYGGGAGMVMRAAPVCDCYEDIVRSIGKRPRVIYMTPQGDYVLTGGELPAMVVIDTVSRLVPGVLNNEESAETESFSDGLLEYPQYTRPADYNGKAVPEVLLSGHHANIEKWRHEKSLERTRKFRPDLYEAYIKEHPEESR